MNKPTAKLIGKLTLVALALICAVETVEIQAQEQERPHAKVLLEKHEFTQGADGTYSHRWYRKVQIFDLNAVDEYADVFFSYNVENDEMIVHKAVTTTAAGKELPAPATAINHTLLWETAEFPDFSAYRTLTVSFVGIDSGSILEFDVEKKSKTTAFPWVIERIVLAQETFVEKVEIALNVGMDAKPQWHIFCAEKQIPQPQMQNNVMRYVWSFQNLEPVYYESAMGAYRWKVPQIYLSTCPSWDLLVKAMHDKFFVKIEPVEALDKKVDDLVKDAVAPAQRLKIIYDYFINNFHRIDANDRLFGYEPRSLETIWRTMYGPKLEQALLFSEMVTHLGGQPALLFGIHRDRVTEKAAGLDFFDTLLLEVTLDNERWTLDFENGPEEWGKWHTVEFVFLKLWSESNSPTLKSRKFMLTSNVADAPATGEAAPPPTNPSPFTWLRFGPSDANQNLARFVLKLDPDKEKEGFFKGSLYSEMKGWFSPFYEVRSDTKAYCEGLLAGFIDEPTIETQNIQMLAIDLCAVQITFTGKLKLTELEQDVNLWSFPTSGAVDAAIPEPLPGKRTQNFILNSALTETAEIQFTLPDDWNLAFKPKEVELQQNSGSVSVKCSLEEKNFSWRRSVTIPMSFITPQEYADFFKLNQLLRDPQYASAVFTKAQTEPGKDHPKDDGGKEKSESK